MQPKSTQFQLKIFDSTPTVTFTNILSNYNFAWASKYYQQLNWTITPNFKRNKILKLTTQTSNHLLQLKETNKKVNSLKRILEMTWVPVVRFCVPMLNDQRNHLWLDLDHRQVNQHKLDKQLRDQFRCVHCWRDRPTSDHWNPSFYSRGMWNSAVVPCWAAHHQNTTRYQHESIYIALDAHSNVLYSWHHLHNNLHINRNRSKSGICTVDQWSYFSDMNHSWLLENATNWTLDQLYSVDSLVREMKLRSPHLPSCRLIIYEETGSISIFSLFFSPFYSFPTVSCLSSFEFSNKNPKFSVFLSSVFQKKKNNFVALFFVRDSIRNQLTQEFSFQNLCIWRWRRQRWSSTNQTKNQRSQTDRSRFLLLSVVVQLILLKFE